MDRSAISVVVLLLLGAFLRESYSVSYREPLQSVFKSFRILEFYCTSFKVTFFALVSHITNLKIFPTSAAIVLPQGGPQLRALTVV